MGTLKSSLKFNRRVTLVDKNTPDIPESSGISSLPGTPVRVLWTTILGETEARIQCEEVLKQISNAQRSPGC